MLLFFLKLSKDGNLDINIISLTKLPNMSRLRQIFHLCLDYYEAIIFYRQLLIIFD